jgi:DNA invertase Pin-like site-specific DNA recombinase
MTEKADGQIVGYRRVSSADQNLERQLEGIKIDRMFEDKLSGKNTDRPALTEMLAYVRPGDTVVCWSMDRLARNLDDLRKLVHGLVERGVKVQFVKESMVYTPEKTNSMSTLLLSIMGSFAEFERSLILERQREGIAVARKSMTYTGRKPTLTDAQILTLIERVEGGKTVASVVGDISDLNIKRKSGELVTSISRQTFNVARANYVRNHPEILTKYPSLKGYVEEAA